MSLEISVVIPTRNRRELLLDCLRSLERQTVEGSRFEVVVVIDGSTDGTRELLEGTDFDLDLSWLDGPAIGLSAARNAGNRAARGALILSLDDDMLAAPELIAAHLEAHCDGVERLVQGALRLAESVARTPYVRYQEALLAEYDADKTGPGASFDEEDVWGGNFSILASALRRVGGFNEALRRNTDGDLAYRLLKSGVSFAYAPRAIAHMTHTNDLDEALQASFQYGRSYVLGQAQLPATRWRHSPFVQDQDSLARRLGRAIYARAGGAGSPWLRPVLRAAIGASEALGADTLTRPLYRLAQDHQYWLGAREAAGGSLGRVLPRRVPILCYHQVSDDHRPAFRRYVLPPARFREQIQWLDHNGYEAISLDQLWGYLEEGSELPAKPVVITFDDGYRALKDTATPCLAEHGFPHTHFLNTGKLDGVTDWVEDAPDLPLLSAEEVKEMVARHGELVDFQAHGRAHLSMEDLPTEVAASEVRHCIDTIEPLTGRPVRYLAYPFGDYDAHTAERMRELPLRLSFTVNRGTCHPCEDRHLLSRVEVFTTDTHLDFVCKVRWGWGPLASLRIHLGDLVKGVAGAVLRELEALRA